MLRPWLFVGFTGHRKLTAPATIARAVRDVLSNLARRTDDPLAAVSSAASGSDTIFAETAAAMELPWTLLLPFPVEEFKKDFADDAEGWERVTRLLPLAVRTVTEPPAETRSDAYLEAGIRTVDECDVLIAVWNGEEAAGRGGTGDVVAYARRQQLPLIWIHSETGVVVEERIEAMPASAAKGHGAVHPDGNPGPQRGDGRKLLDETFRFHADAANRLRPRAVNLNLSLVILHQVSVALTLTILIWSDTWVKDPAASAKFALLLVAFVLPWFLRRAHGEWLIHRLRSEIFRSAATLWPLPNPEDILPELRLPAEDRLQRSILLLRLLSPVPATDLRQARETYAAERVAKQFKYFHASARQASRWQRRLTFLGWGCTGAAIFLGLLPSLGVINDTMPLFRPLRHFGYLLPLVTSALLATVAARDLERRAARYGEVANSLRRAGTQLHHARTWTRLTRVIIDIERTLLLEVWEWYALARFTRKG